MNVFEEIKKRIKPMVCGGMNDPQWIPFRGLIEMLDDVEKDYNNGWIPCSERLPEDNQTCLTTARIYVTPDHVDEPNSYIGLELDIYSAKCGWLKNANVIAWQPLPQPYKGGVIYVDIANKEKMV